MRLALLPVVVFLLLSPYEAEAQVELRGRLVSAAGEPIPGAAILLSSVGYSVRSDSTGRFTLSGQQGATMVLFFTAPRFRRDSAVVVLKGRVVERDFTLVDANTPVPESNLSAAMLRGIVVEESGVPLSYANVQVNYGARLVADDSGRFQIPYEEGTRTLLVRRIGFEPVELRLQAKPDTALRIVLKPIAMQLKEVTVVAAGAAYRSLDIHGFYRRMRDGERGATNGWFITPEDIERRKATSTTQMADGFPNIRVYKSGMGPMWDRIMGPGNCEMTVYLDNVRITNDVRGGSEPVNQMVPVTHMAAMEIYPRAFNAPATHPSYNGLCGVVLIWTK